MGNTYIRARPTHEVLLSAHVCHPSLANDNCSGVALLAHVAKRICAIKTRYSYRFLFAPGTIGAITWLACNEDRVAQIMHGLIVSCVGDGSGPTYKKSRRGDTEIDRAVCHALTHSGHQSTILEFSPYGHDERQYCSPGFDLAVGLFQRGQFGMFPEYHTSADNLDFIGPEHLRRVMPDHRDRDRRPGRKCILPEHRFEMRTAAWQEGPLPRHRRRQRHGCQEHGHALGAESVRRQTLVA